MAARLIIANWKMNPPPAGFDGEDSPYKPQNGVETVVCPMAIDLVRCLAAGIVCGAQFARPEASGAFTGDVSVTSVQALGCRYVLCGHSERRRYHGETDEFVRAQVDAALVAGLTPVLCIGEQDGENREDVLTRQLKDVPNESTIVLAYEPVWAIGTGKAALAADAAVAAAFIRETLGFTSPRLVYGGSVAAANAESFLSEKGIDGLLIGNASLKPADFSAILSIAKTLAA